MSGQSKEKYLVAHCEFVVCLTHKKAWDDVDVSGKVLAPRILSAEEEITAVRLVEGEAKQYANGPILPEDPIPEEIEMVQEAFVKYGARLPSGRVVFDVITFNADHPQPETPLEGQS